MSQLSDPHLSVAMSPGPANLDGNAFTVEPTLPPTGSRIVNLFLDECVWRAGRE